MTAVEQSSLGKASAYVSQYDPTLLFAIPRQEQRLALGLTSTRLPFMGADCWTAYELSWLNAKGKPQVAIARFAVPCESPCIVESKSVKLYLNSFTQSVFDSVQSVRDTLAHDLSEAVSGLTLHGAGQLAVPTQSMAVAVDVLSVADFEQERMGPLSGLSLDRLDIECHQYEPNAHLLQVDRSQGTVSQTLTSDLLKSNCLVTGQPDWGSIQISYTGHPVDEAGLLRYLVSFRNHNEFHEHCVERIFLDFWQQCQPLKLQVYARYTRRGGVEINPFRTSYAQPMPTLVRTPRQ